MKKALFVMVLAAGCGGGGSSGSGGSSTASSTAPGFVVDIYDATQAYNGTTLFPDVHDPAAPRIVEVDMTGAIVWEYALPPELVGSTVGLDVEYEPATDTILFVSPQKGVYRINRSGTIVWSHLEDKISHDADPLADGHVLYCWGASDAYADTQVKEIDAAGNVVWSWAAKDEPAFNVSPYIDIQDQGWTHTNAVTRLANGNTLVSLRNFNMTIEVNSTGTIVWSYDWFANGLGSDPHDPEFEPGPGVPTGNVLVALQNDPLYQAAELNRESGAVVWSVFISDLTITRDADRLPNGNTLLQGVLSSTKETVILEVNVAGDVVWRMKYVNAPALSSPGWIYKAQRVGS